MTDTQKKSSGIAETIVNNWPYIYKDVMIEDSYYTSLQFFTIEHAEINHPL